MKTMVTLTHEEAQSYLAYALICETMEGSRWNSGCRRRLYSLFLAQKDVIREKILESLAAMLNPIPTHYEWRSNDCPYDYSGELYEDGKVRRLVDGFFFLTFFAISR